MKTNLFAILTEIAEEIGYPYRVVRKAYELFNLTPDTAEILYDIGWQYSTKKGLKQDYKTAGYTDWEATTAANDDMQRLCIACAAGADNVVQFLNGYIHW